MEADHVLHIEIFRVINAPRWRVIRQVTRVEAYSAVIPTIEEIKVIEKSKNVLKTQWRIVLDGVPVNWVENDTLDFKQGIITFQAREGDLRDFGGVWRFTDHPEGTEVKIEIYFRVGIPGVENFTDEYFRPLIRKYFESILDVIEKKLISSRYSSFMEGNKNKIAGFGVLGHFYNYNHMLKSFKSLSPEFQEPSKEFLKALFKIMPTFIMHHMKEFRSQTGETTHGDFILCTFIPDMVENDTEAVYTKVVNGCKLAEKSGVGILTLGGFTSIVGERLNRRISEDVDIPLTTGNSFTAAMAIEGIIRAVQLVEKDISDLTVAIVGGTGDIGSACARALVSQVRKIIITGRTGYNLRTIKDELKRYHQAQIEITKSNFSAVTDADVVIAAANSSASILQMSWFKTGSIVCDLGYPKNLSYTSDRNDIFVFSGGLATTPTPIDPGNDIGVPSKNVCYGCFCEAIILALEKRYENFSFGRGNITKEKMNEIKDMGSRHGFELAPFFWGNGLTDKENLDRVRRVAQ